MKPILIIATAFLMHLQATGQVTQDILTGVADSQKQNLLKEWMPYFYTFTGEVKAYENKKDKGAITIHLMGGIAPFTYAWSNGATTKDIKNLKPGDYVLTITDATGRQICNLFTVIDNQLNIKSSEDDTSLLVRGK